MPFQITAQILRPNLNNFSFPVLLNSLYYNVAIKSFYNCFFAIFRYIKKLMKLNHAIAHVDSCEPQIVLPAVKSVPGLVDLLANPSWVSGHNDILMVRL